MDVDGSCWTDSYGVEVGMNEKCGDDTKLRNYFGFCLQICPPDRPLPDNRGNCHSYDEENAIDLYFNEEMVRGGYDNTEISSQFCGLCPNREIVLQWDFSYTHRLCVTKNPISKIGYKAYNVFAPLMVLFFWFAPVTIPVTILLLILLCRFIKKNKSR